MKMKFCSFLILLVFCIACDDNDEKKQTTLAEGFDDVASLIYNNWAIKDNSSPRGMVWEQGKVASYISAQSGPANSFLTIRGLPFVLPSVKSSSWVVTPVITMKSGDRFIFFTKSNGGTEYENRDRLQVRRNVKSTDVHVGDTPEDVGDFTTILLDINPTELLGNYPNQWERYELLITDLPEAKKGRLAFRYFLNEQYLESNGIAIDSVAFIPR